MDNLIVLFVVIPLLGACGCLFGKFWPRAPIAPIVSIAVILSCFALLIALYPSVIQQGQMRYTIGGWQETVGIQQHFDGLSWMSFAITLLIALVSLVFAIAERPYTPTFYFLYLIMLAGIAGVLLAADLFNLFVCFELLGLTSYILIAYFQKDRAILASFKYLLLSSLGMSFFLIGILIIYQHTGSLSLYGTSASMTKNSASCLHLTLAIVALIAGVGVRTAFLPFHAWLPDAHAHAPHPVSAMLSGIIIKVSFLAIWRLVQAFQPPFLQPAFIWIGAGTASIGVVWALMQTDCKKLLAWHSISQMGYILTAFGAGHALALTASFTHVLNHSLFKSLLFLCIGAVIHVTDERDIKRLGKLNVRLPALMILFVAGALSIAGIPPFNGFISKKLITASVTAYPVAAALLWLTGIGTAASFIKLSTIFTKRGASTEIEDQPTTRLSTWVYAPLAVLAVLCLSAGVFGSALVKRIFFLISGQPLLALAAPYALKNVLNAGISACAGLAIYLLLMRPAGQRFTETVRGIRLSLNNALLLFVTGFVALAAIMLVVAM